MAGMYRVTNPEGFHIGTVMSFAGEPAATRWWAFSIYRRDPTQEHKRGFKTRREAIEWLLEQVPAA